MQSIAYVAQLKGLRLHRSHEDHVVLQRRSDGLFAAVPLADAERRAAALEVDVEVAAVAMALEMLAAYDGRPAWRKERSGVPGGIEIGVLYDGQQIVMVDDDERHFRLADGRLLRAEDLP